MQEQWRKLSCMECLLFFFPSQPSGFIFLLGLTQLLHFDFDSFHTTHTRFIYTMKQKIKTDPLPESILGHGLTRASEGWGLLPRSPLYQQNNSAHNIKSCLLKPQESNHNPTNCQWFSQVSSDLGKREKHAWAEGKWELRKQQAHVN